MDVGFANRSGPTHLRRAYSSCDERSVLALGQGEVEAIVDRLLETQRRSVGWAGWCYDALRAQDGGDSTSAFIRRVGRDDATSE